MSHSVKIGNFQIIGEPQLGDPIPVAIVGLTPGDVSLFWSPEVFSGLLDDELRAALVRVLRLHADKLESREMDARMRDLMRPQS